MEIESDPVNYFIGNVSLLKLGLYHGHFRKYSEHLYDGKLRMAASDTMYVKQVYCGVGK